MPFYQASNTLRLPTLGVKAQKGQGQFPKRLISGAQRVVGSQAQKQFKHPIHHGDTEYTENPLNCGLRIVLMEKVFINSKSEIRNRQSAIKGPSVSPW